LTKLKALRFAGLLSATILVHFWLIFEAQQNPQTAPFNDVNLYGFWANQVSQSHMGLGIDTPWVYPFLAMAPILLANFIGGTNGILTGWLILIGLLNLIGLSALVDWGKEGKAANRAASFYLAFLALLGPVAIGRIDSAATFVALLGLVQLYRDRLRLAMVFFTLGAWVKIWPIAAAIALFSATKAKVRALLVASIACFGILALGFFLGGNQHLFSFVTTQGNRGLQIESVAATFWVWAAHLKVPGAGIYFDNALVTNQVSGPFSTEVSVLLGYVMAGALAITVWLGLRAYRAGADHKQLFVVVLLTATLDLIVFNKVGSPQFEGWLAVPLMAGLLLGLPKWRIPMAIGLTIALLTNLIYPVFYTDLMMLGDLGVWLLTVRNAALVFLLVWANLRLQKMAV
jgi:hypothetical protein